MIQKTNMTIDAYLRNAGIKPANAAGLFANPDIDGGLIGGASLDAGDFLAICTAGGGD